MSDRTQWAQAAVDRAATLAPLAEAAAPFFDSREAMLISQIVEAGTDDKRREIASALRAVRDLRSWLRGQEANGQIAQRELNKSR